MCVQIIKTMFLNTKLQGLTIASCTVHNIMKGFSLHVLDAVIFVPQALKTVTIHFMGSETLPEITVCEHSLPYQPQM